MRTSPEIQPRRRALRRVMGIVGGLLLLSTVNANHQNHSSQRLYAQSVGEPVPIPLPHLPPDCVKVAITAVCETTTTSTTTTSPPETTTTLAPTTTEAPPPDTTPPEPVDGSKWEAPEGCLEPMGPQEGKSREEAHRCWDGLLALYPWPIDQAFSEMYCESKGNTYAANPNSTARGLMQVLGGSTDPHTNMQQAYDIYSETNSWRRWACQPYSQN